MKKKELRRLFDKYTRNECSEREIELLDSYLNSFQGKKQLWTVLDCDEDVIERIWSRIKSDVDGKNVPVKNMYRLYLKYAAIFLGLLVGVGVWHQMSKVTPIVKSIEIVAKDSPVILKMPDGESVPIDAKGEQVLANKAGKLVAQQNGAQIRYIKNNLVEEVVFNEVIVPHGKKFQIILSDGTMVFINSGSSLRFPTNFLAGKERQVFLEGEAYFEVAKDEARPFLVTSSEIGIKVLGTHFVVSSYKESEKFAVLAEGSVAVYRGQVQDSPTIIAPGEKATIQENDVLVKSVHISDYLNWMEGSLSFNDELFKEIVLKIERHYGVEVENNYGALDSMKFKGSFKDESISDLLDTFKESAGFDYEIEHNKIIINNKK